MFNSHQYISQDIMDKEDFAVAWQIQQQQLLTQDQHQQPVFVNTNARLVYVTVPCHWRSPRTRLILVPPPSFWQVMQDANPTGSDTTFSYKEADQSVSVLSDQTLTRQFTINWTTSVACAEDICTVINNLYHLAQFFFTDMIEPAILYKISSILTNYYADDDQNMTIWTKYTNWCLYYRYYGINSPNTRCNILKCFIVF